MLFEASVLETSSVGEKFKFLPSKQIACHHLSFTALALRRMELECLSQLRLGDLGG
jgi:hypothetical protein